MQKITPFLWFDDQAEEAARFYVSIFKKSKIVSVARYNKSAARVSGRQEGSVMTVKFQLDGHDFVALNGGPHFKFTEAISFVIGCRTQKELDTFWKKLSDGGQESQCGWLKDRYGVSWQIVPAALDDWLTAEDGRKSQRVMEALLKMTKLDIKALERAGRGSKTAPD